MMFKVNLDHQGVAYVLAILLGLVYLLGLGVPLNDNDAAHHATIALRMYLENDWVNLISHGEPYLDKPHGQFWILHLSFILFGVTTFAYKISSLLFSVLTLVYVYKLTKLLFDQKIAFHATLVSATSFAFLMSNVDVRMDAMLTGCVVFAVYYFFNYFHNAGWLNLLLATFGAAFAFSIKGLFGVVIIGLFVLSYAFANRMIYKLLRWQFLAMILVFFIFISPVLYAFYLQFDLHPEMVIRGTTNHSGIKFILFQQNTSRLGGEFGSSSSKDYLFFFHTLLWSLLPWSLLFYGGLVSAVKQSWRSKSLYHNKTLALIIPLLIIYTMMGFSQFKLPHYMLPTYPFAAIVVAYFVSQLHKNYLLRWSIVQHLQYVLLFVMAILVNFWIFPLPTSGMIAFLVMCLVLIFTFFKIKHSPNQFILQGVIAVLVFWLPFNAHFFPQLLTYQGGQLLAKKVNELQLPNHQIYWLEPLDYPYSFDYYSNCIHTVLSVDDLNNFKHAKKPIYLFVEEIQLQKLNNNQINYTIMQEANDYRITRLKGNFLNPKTRKSQLQKVFLVSVN